RLQASELGLALADEPRDLLGVVLCRLDEVVEVTAREERVLRRRDDHAVDVVLLCLEPVDGLRHRLGVGRVHRVGRLLRIVEREDDDAVVALLVADRVAHQRASTTVAMPMPPPTHSVARPYLPPVRCSSSTSVPRIMPPVAPSGWPIAIAPPLTLTFSMSRPMSLTNRSTTAANASLISTRSRSSTPMPAFASAFLEAGAGPVSMIVGSAPLTAVTRIRALGSRPSSLPVASLPIASSEAPSTMPE